MRFVIVFACLMVVSMAAPEASDEKEHSLTDLLLYADLMDPAGTKVTKKSVDYRQAPCTSNGQPDMWRQNWCASVVAQQRCGDSLYCSRCRQSCNAGTDAADWPATVCNNLKGWNYCTDNKIRNRCRTVCS